MIFGPPHCHYGIASGLLHFFNERDECHPQQELGYYGNQSFNE